MISPKKIKNTVQMEEENEEQSQAEIICKQNLSGCCVLLGTAYILWFFHPESVYLCCLFLPV